MPPSTQTCEHVHSFLSSFAIFCFLFATITAAWMIALMGLMETTAQGKLFIKFIGRFVLKLPMVLLMVGGVTFFWVQVWMMFTNLPLWMAIIELVSGCVMAIAVCIAAAITIQGVYAAHGAAEDPEDLSRTKEPEQLETGVPV